MFSCVNKTFEILLIMKSEITIYFAIFYWITFQGPAQHDALIAIDYSRAFWFSRTLFTTYTALREEERFIWKKVQHPLSLEASALFCLQSNPPLMKATSVDVQWQFLVGSANAQ